MNDSLKHLITLLAQSGGTITIPLPDLTSAGVEITLSNISSDKHGTITLRLGPKIYYVPAKPTEEPQCPTKSDQPQPPPSPETSQASSEKLQDRIAEEIGAINRINNRPPQAQSPQSPALHRPMRTVNTSEEFPPSPVGVYHQTDLSSFLREREIAEVAVERDAGRVRRGRGTAEDGVMPFKVMELPPKPHHKTLRSREKTES